MSTRAIIAIPRRKKPDIKGIYLHSDGYPTEVAAALFAMYHSDAFGADHAKLFAHLGVHRHGLRFLMVTSGIPEGAEFECYCHDRGEAEEREKDPWLRNKDRGGIDYTYVLTSEGLIVGRFASSHLDELVPWSSEGADWKALETRLRR